MPLASGAALTAAWRIQNRVLADLARDRVLTEAVAAGDLTVTVHGNRADEIGNLLRPLDSMVDRLHESMLTVRQASDQIAGASNEIAHGNNALSQRTELTAGSLQMTRGSIEQLAGTVHQPAESAATTNALAATARDVAQRGAAVVAQVVSAMQGINSSSRRMADIVGTDGMTHPNAALVKQPAAAAESLRPQAGLLIEVVMRLKMPGDSTPTPQPVTVAAGTFSRVRLDAAVSRGTQRSDRSASAIERFRPAGFALGVSQPLTEQP